MNKFRKEIVTPLLIFSVIGIIVAIALVWMLSKRAFANIDNMASLVFDMADGNTDETLNYYGTDEVGKLADAIRRLKDRLSENEEYIKELSLVLEKMGKGNFDVSLKLSYEGKFSVLKKDIYNISNSLTLILGKIKGEVKEGRLGAEELTKGAEILSEGALTQAASLEELASGMEDIRERAGKTAKSASEAKNFTDQTEREIFKSNEKMNQLSDAMEEIKNRSGEIEKIIKTIDDIAFQTNILALNAAVEAARAGEAGKGFAVVADEVRTLAGKSAEAAGSITDLIKSTIDAVDKGDFLTDETVKALNNVRNSSEFISGLIKEISLEAKDESVLIEHLTDGISEISDVVQTNSATTRESAGRVTDLSIKIASIDDLVNKFILP